MGSTLILGPTLPPIQWGPEASSPWVKWLSHKADHSHLSSEIKNAWLYTFTPQYIFMV